jgi:galactokinase/mevalonate kinase-like predicted kinase
MDRNPDVNEEEVGIQSFNLRRNQAVERSMAKIRHHLSYNWSALTDNDIKTLEWILGEVWSAMGFYRWDKIDLSKVSLDKVYQIISEAKKIRSSGKTSLSHLKPIMEKLETL